MVFWQKISNNKKGKTTFRNWATAPSGLERVCRHWRWPKWHNPFTQQRTSDREAVHLNLSKKLVCQKKVYNKSWLVFCWNRMESIGPVEQEGGKEEKVRRAGRWEITWRAHVRPSPQTDGDSGFRVWRRELKVEKELTDGFACSDRKKKILKPLSESDDRILL